MIDFHQHIGHYGRTVEHVLAHQDAHGVRQSVILPIDGTATLPERWLEEFPNLYGDLSAGSGFNALSRDPEFTRGFLRRHQSKLLWATDCPCRDGKGDWGEDRTRECMAARSLPLLREVTAPDAFAQITSGNARRLLRLD
jgi:predicted TIM-barrel fold metal-dependent hydrolase